MRVFHSFLLVFGPDEFWARSRGTPSLCIILILCATLARGKVGIRESEAGGAGNALEENRVRHLAGMRSMEIPKNGRGYIRRIPSTLMNVILGEGALTYYFYEPRFFPDDEPSRQIGFDAPRARAQPKWNINNDVDAFSRRSATMTSIRERGEIGAAKAFEDHRAPLSSKNGGARVSASHARKSGWKVALGRNDFSTSPERKLVEDARNHAERWPPVPSDCSHFFLFISANDQRLSRRRVPRRKTYPTAAFDKK
ncbi:hypothetical protein KM043_000806 [Ampulex compressa]|nr:hypothetical protein KM043_000806 [Ampulex compressa]